MYEELKKKILKIKGRYWYKELTNDEINIIIKETSFLPNKYDIKIRRIYFIHNLTSLQICPTCGKEIQWDRKHQKFGKRCSKECYIVPDGVTIDQINNETNFLPSDISFKNRVGYYRLKIKKYKKCLICDKAIDFDNKHLTFPDYCSSKCRKQGQKYINEKRKDSWSNKNKEEISIINNKRKNTVNEKYGVDNVFQNEDIKVRSNEKRQKTNNEKYGVNYYIISDDFKEKKKKTLLETVGVDNPMKFDDYKNNQQDSLYVNYNVRNPMKSETIKQRVKDTNNEKYGVDNVFQNDDIKEKIKKTVNEKYNVDYYSQSNEYKEKIKKTQRESYWDSFITLLKQKRIEPLFDKHEYITYNYGENNKKYKCLKCDKSFETVELKVQKIYCKKCATRMSQSEREISEWIKEENKNINILTNKFFKNSDNKRYELDIYLPDFNIGIEYHGLYWHSELYKDKNYHKNKYEFFKEQGIEVIQIFENEWVLNLEIVKSIIRTKIGVVKRKLYGRQCTIRSIENDEYKQFCELNHLQGYGIAKVRLGLYYNDELVQIMSFSTPRFNKSYDWENIRTCSKINTIITGGFSKLLKHFKKNYKGSIISYVDARYFNGKGYINNGFEKIGHSNPNFFYFKTQSIILENRMKFQKHKLKDILNNYNENVTSNVNMLNNDYLRIFDAGNIILKHK